MKLLVGLLLILSLVNTAVLGYVNEQNKEVHLEMAELESVKMELEREKVKVLLDIAKRVKDIKSVPVY